MKSFKTFFVAFAILSIQYSLGQNVIELPFKPLENDYIELSRTLEKIETDDQKSIDICINALKKFKDSSIRDNLIFWELSFHYANLKQYDKCYEILKKGQEEGLSYFIQNSSDPFPPYLRDLEKIDGFKTFLSQNMAMLDAERKTAKTEFTIQLPNGYDKTKKYPLILIMHGGIGSIFNLMYNYDSPKLKGEFITVYFQGSIVRSKFLRSFSEDWQKRILEGFERVKLNYPIDTNRIILAGPSAGGARSLDLGLNNIISAKGLLLSYSVAPSNLDSTAYIKSAKRGLKIALLCGEYDWAIKQQKELGYNFDKYGITNRFVVFPDKGHEFPDNWSYYLDTSLEFILKEE